MTVKKYTKFDQLILDNVGEGTTAKALARAVKQQAIEFTTGSSDVLDVVKRRVRFLQKEGKLSEEIIRRL